VLWVRSARARRDEEDEAKKCALFSCLYGAGTGIALFGGLALFSLGYLPSSKQLTAHLYSLQQYPILNALVKFGVVTPLTYHYLGGLRHLVRLHFCYNGNNRACFIWCCLQAWDSVVGHDMKFVKTTGWGATAIAGAAGVIAMFTTCHAEEK
jgi:succinate dehydrogenase/fumarate reductase cytochrome b subunit